jgi:Spy/CpxP family protein refolding chaperone
MKTNQSILSRIMLMLFFSLILMNVSAQTRNDASRPPLQKVHGQVPAPPDAPAPPPPPPPPPPATEPMDDAPQHMNIPDLTEVQKTEIGKLRLKQIESMTPLKNQVREKKARLQTILTTMPVDMNTADVVADELGKIQTSVLKLKIHHDQALRSLLTPDQQVIFDARPKPFLNKMK